MNKCTIEYLTTELDLSLTFIMHAHFKFIMWFQILNVLLERKNLPMFLQDFVKNKILKISKFDLYSHIAIPISQSTP